jgi:hypothetical protein
MSRSAAALRVVDFSHDRAPELCVGDLVRTGDNLYPHYEIVAMSGDRAWIRDVQYGSDHVVPMGRLRKVA